MYYYTVTKLDQRYKRDTAENFIKPKQKIIVQLRNKKKEILENTKICAAMEAPPSLTCSLTRRFQSIILNCLLNRVLRLINVGVRQSELG